MGIVGGIDGLLSPPTAAQVLDAEPFRLREPVYLPPPGAPTEQDLDEWTEGLRIARRLREERRASLPVRLRPQTTCLDSLDDFGVVQAGSDSDCAADLGEDDPRCVDPSEGVGCLPIGMFGDVLSWG